MKKTRKNRYAGSQPEERYGLGTRKSLYLDRPTSHGGWPEGEYDPPINDRIYDYLKSMGLVQETHLRKVIRDILSEVSLDPPVVGRIFKTPEQKIEKNKIKPKGPLCRTPIPSDLPPGDLSTIAKYLGLSLVDFFKDFVESAVTGELKRDLICLGIRGHYLVPMAHAPSEMPGSGWGDDPHLIAAEQLAKTHDVISKVGVAYEPADILDAILYLYESYDRSSGGIDKEKIVMALLALIFAIPIIKHIIKDKNVLLTPTDPRLQVVIGAIRSLLTTFKESGIPNSGAALDYLDEFKKDLTTTGVDVSPIVDDKERRQNVNQASKMMNLMPK